MLAHVVRLVGDEERRARAAATVRARAGRDRLVGHGHAVAVGRLATFGVGAVRVQVDPVARRVGGPLPADVRGRRGHDHALHAAGGEHLVRHAQAERGLAGGRGGGREEARAAVRAQRAERRDLPGPEGAVGGPCRERSSHRGSRQARRRGGGKPLVAFLSWAPREPANRVLGRTLSRALLAAIVATALAAAPAAASQDPNPHWPQLLPPFPVSSDHQPGPVPHCRRGRLSCIDGTLRRMRRTVRRLGCDHRAVFATTYYTLTRVLRAHRRVFRDRRYLAFEVTQFSNYWFRTLRREERGKPIPAAWRIAIDAARHGEINGGQDMLLGINAHVQRDMPYVMAELGLVRPHGASRKRNHDVMNDVLDAAYQPVVDAIRRRYDPLVSLTNASWNPLDDVGGLEMVKAWREGVWRNATRLVNARTPAQWRQVSMQIEVNAANWARMMAAPQTPGYRPRRDAYCRARLHRRARRGSTRR